MADLIGQEIGNYRLITRLASGGFGNVYLAQHTLLPERKVAIKLLHTFLSSQEERDQFLQEARFLEQLKHPHILPLIDVGVSDNLPYLVTEFAAGGSLRDLLKQHQAPGLPQDMALTILSEICKALQYAHQRQVIHRDLKPENILFNNKGEVLLADFGISMVLANASIERVEFPGGTPSYMAPEQFEGVISKESDQYALGCIAYEMFTGRKPFAAPNFLAMAYKHAAEAPIPPTQLNPEIPRSVEAAILKALAKQRNLRYPNVSAFMEAMMSSPSPLQGVGMPLTGTDSLQETVPTQKSVLEPDLPVQQRPKRGQLLRLSRYQLAAMLLGTIMCSAIIVYSQKSLQISVSVGAWVYQPMIPVGSICIWCLLLTITFFLGARFGPLAGLVVGGVGFFLGGYISFITGVNNPGSLWHYIGFYYAGNQSLDSTPGYPILTSYFNLSLALAGFVAGFAFFKTSGRYFTAHSFVIAERYSVLGAVIAGIAIFLVLVAWRAFPQGALFVNLSLKFWLSCIPALLLLPCLLLAGNAFVRGYDKLTERRRRTFHADAAA